MAPIGPAGGEPTFDKGRASGLEPLTVWGMFLGMFCQETEAYGRFGHRSSTAASALSLLFARIAADGLCQHARTSLRSRHLELL